MGLRVVFVYPSGQVRKARLSCRMPRRIGNFFALSMCRNSGSRSRSGRKISSHLPVTELSHNNLRANLQTAAAAALSERVLEVLPHLGGACPARWSKLQCGLVVPSPFASTGSCEPA